MKASTQYKKRLAALLAPKNLEGHLPEPEGRTKLDSARNLESICDKKVSHAVIADWKSRRFSNELDSEALSAVCMIVAHMRKSPIELQVYLQTGAWLSVSVVTQVNGLIEAKNDIDSQISALIAA